ncbi:MAG TPA: IS481 family transposase, partial [Acetobacteraceae bacterium]|nr:IS481 family transposase [Acetobacteraceae bacterium]
MPAEALVSLRRRLDAMPARSADRKGLIAGAASLYGVSRATLYRALKQPPRPKAIRRKDRGHPRKIALPDLERYCETIAALKIRTSNKKGRHLSTVRAIELMETYGIETPDGLVQPPAGLLRRTTVNRYLQQWGYDHTHMTREPPAVRFQARRSNELWQFDLSPSDLKQVKHPLWAEAGRGNPTLMLYSVVDDRSGVAYQEYRCVYGEDVEAALRFMFNAMAPKAEDGLVIQGIPE